MNNPFERPKVEPIFNANDRLIETLGWGIIVCSFAFAGWGYFQLSGPIPVHFNLKGEPDGYDVKSMLFVPPAISAAMFIGLTYLNKFPWLFNYPTSITADNASYQYTVATRLIRVLKTAVVGIFASVVVSTYFVAKGKSSGLGVWPEVISLVFIFGPLVYAVVKMLRGK